MTATTDTPKPGVSGRARNAWQHGARAAHGATLGRAPKGLARQVADARKLMADVLAEVCVLRGEAKACDMSTAVELAEAEVTRRACWRLWQRNIGKLSVQDELQLRQATERAAATRSKYLRSLGLAEGAKPVDPWAEIYRQSPALPAPATQEAAHDPAVIPGPDAAPAGQPGVPLEGGHDA